MNVNVSAIIIGSTQTGPGWSGYGRSDQDGLVTSSPGALSVPTQIQLVQQRRGAGVRAEEAEGSREKVIQSLEARIEATRAKFTEINQKKDALQREFEQITAKQEASQKEVSAKIEALAAQLQQQTAAAKMATTGSLALKQKHAELTALWRAVEVQLAQKQAELEKVQVECTGLQAEVESVNKQSTSYASGYSSFSSERSSLEPQLRIQELRVRYLNKLAGYRFKN